MADGASPPVVPLSRSSLYNTFGSKRELFDRALGHYVEMLDGHLLAPLASGRESLLDIDRFVDRLTAQLDDPAFVASCLLTKA